MISEFEASLVYIVSSRTVRADSETLFKKKQKQKQKTKTSIIKFVVLVSGSSIF